MSEVVLERPPREVIALVEGLPATSRFVAHTAGGDKWREWWGWGPDRHMFADLFDLEVQVNTPEKKKPFRYPRPGAKPAQQGIPLMSMIPRKKNPEGS